MATSGSTGGGATHSYDVIKCGFLKKQKTNKSRFFVLRGPTRPSTAEGAAVFQQQRSRLEYYESEQQYRKGKQPRKTFVLSPSLLIQRCEDTSARATTSFGISLIIPPSNSAFVMLAETEQEQSDWIAALNDVQGLSVSSTERFKHVWEVNVVERHGLGRLNLKGQSILTLTSTHIHLRRVNSTVEVSFPLRHIRQCGSRSEFFVFECGRFCDHGEGEVWVTAEDATIAHSIHETTSSAMRLERSRQGVEEPTQPRSRSSSQNEPASTSLSSLLMSSWGPDAGQRSGTLPPSLRRSAASSSMTSSSSSSQASLVAPRSRTISDGVITSPSSRHENSSPGRSATSTALSNISGHSAPHGVGVVPGTAVPTATTTAASYSRSISVPVQQGNPTVSTSMSLSPPYVLVSPTSDFIDERMSTSVSSNFSADSATTGSSVDDYETSPRDRRFPLEGEGGAGVGFRSAPGFHPASGDLRFPTGVDPRSMTPESPRGPVGVVGALGPRVAPHPGIAEESDNYIDMHSCRDDGDYIPMTGQSSSTSTPLLITGKPPIGPGSVASLAGAGLQPSTVANPQHPGRQANPSTTSSANASNAGPILLPPSNASPSDNILIPTQTGFCHRNTSYNRRHLTSTSSNEDNGGYVEMFPPSRPTNNPSTKQDYENVDSSKVPTRQGVSSSPLASQLEHSGYVPMHPPAKLREADDGEYVPMLPPTTLASSGIPVPPPPGGVIHRRATPPSSGSYQPRMTPPPSSGSLISSPFGGEESDYMEMNLSGGASTTPPSASVRKKSASPSAGAEARGGSGSTPPKPGGIFGSMLQNLFRSGGSGSSASSSSGFPRGSSEESPYMEMDFQGGKRTRSSSFTKRLSFQLGGNHASSSAALPPSRPGSLHLPPSRQRSDTEGDYINMMPSTSEVIRLEAEKELEKMTPSTETATSAGGTPFVSAATSGVMRPKSFSLSKKRSTSARQVSGLPMVGPRVGATPSSDEAPPLSKPQTLPPSSSIGSTAVGTLPNLLSLGAIHQRQRSNPQTEREYVNAETRKLKEEGFAATKTKPLTKSAEAAAATAAASTAGNAAKTTTSVSACLTTTTPATTTFVSTSFVHQPSGGFVKAARLSPSCSTTPTQELSPTSSPPYRQAPIGAITSLSPSSASQAPTLSFFSPSSSSSSPTLTPLPATLIESPTAAPAFFGDDESVRVLSGASKVSTAPMDSSSSPRCGHCGGALAFPSGPTSDRLPELCACSSRHPSQPSRLRHLSEEDEDLDSNGEARFSAASQGFVVSGSGAADDEDPPPASPPFPIPLTSSDEADVKSRYGRSESASGMSSGTSSPTLVLQNMRLMTPRASPLPAAYSSTAMILSGNISPSSPNKVAFVFDDPTPALEDPPPEVAAPKEAAQAPDSSGADCRSPSDESEVGDDALGEPSPISSSSSISEICLPPLIAASAENASPPEDHPAQHDVNAAEAAAAANPVAVGVMAATTTATTTPSVVR